MRQAIVVLPAAMGGRIEARQDRRWLSRSDLRTEEAPMEGLARVLSVIGIQPPDEGLAALRLWGQTGDRPNVWMAAVDPVHLEPRLDHLRIHALLGAQSPAGDLRAIFDFLQKSLGEDTSFAFARVGKHGYLRGDEAIETAAVSASQVHGREPDEFMPSGETATGYHRLLSEVQMSLHEHEVNARREAEGLFPVNSVWFWGGGKAPEKVVRKLPPLFGDDPLFKGYWESCTGVIEPWPGNFAKCLEVAVKDFVAVTAEADKGDLLAAYLGELRQLVKNGQLTRLILLFRDGLTAGIGRFDGFRFWRRTHKLL